MKRKQFIVKSILSNDAYNAVLKCALETCTTVTLVHRPELALEFSGRQFLEKSSKFLKKVAQSDRWPGTTLIGHTATVYVFVFNKAFSELLSSEANTPFDWRQPEHLEDLSFIRSDGQEWFVSIAHDAFGYFYVDDMERRKLLSSVSGLELEDGIELALGPENWNERLRTSE